MLSGIGPEEHLKERGVEVVKHVPGVGANLQDHPAVLVSFNSEGKAAAKGKSHSSQVKLAGSTKLNPVALAKWLIRGVGPLTSPGCDHGGFIFSSPEARAASPLPDIQYRFLASKTISPDGMSTIAEKFVGQKEAHPDGFTLQTICARPHSRGQLRLQSNDPRDKPVMEGVYLEDERDVQSLVNGIKRAREILAQESLSPYRSEEEFPGAGAVSDADLADYCRSTVHSANALVGTCKMGAAGDAQAVVDSDLRVRGVAGVRVCDSSIMPKLPGGQTASSTIAIAEKAADILESGLTVSSMGSPSSSAPAPVAS